MAVDAMLVARTGTRLPGWSMTRKDLPFMCEPMENPMDINSTAPVITRDEILIHAPVERIWKIQTDVAQWPSWQPDVDGVQVDGPLAVGTVFRWQTSGLDITSTVEEIDAPGGLCGADQLKASPRCMCGRCTNRLTACWCEPPNHGKVSRSWHKPRFCRMRSTDRYANGLRT